MFGAGSQIPGIDAPLQSWVTLVIAAVAAVGQTVASQKAKKKKKKREREALKNAEAEETAKMTLAKNEKLPAKTVSSSFNLAPIVTILISAIAATLILRKK